MILNKDNQTIPEMSLLKSTMRDTSVRKMVEKSEAELSRSFVDIEQDEENVLLLTMSTISDHPKMYRYCDDCKEKSDRFCCTGISQLEPGTKKILYQLAKEGKKLNRIVIVESEKARREEASGISKDFWDDPEYMSNKYWSAVCFYKQRILDYIQRKYQKGILSDESCLIENYESLERHFPDNVQYSEEELSKLFYDIPTKNTSEKGAEDSNIYPEESLELFMEIIHGIKGDKGNRIHLYMDMQGGARSAIQQVNAIMELLKGQDVDIKGRYAVPQFNPRDQKEVHMIKEVGELYKTYEMVSAMTEFKLYGRGRGLTSFFKNVNDPTTADVLDVVNQISGAIALCNMDAFDQALTDMKSLQIKIENNDMSVSSQLKLVFQDIIMNYSELLKDDERSQFDIVEWCINKDYYQQAITIIESKMPKMLVECGLLIFHPKGKAEDILLENNRKCLWPYEGDKNIKILIESMEQKQEWKNLENFLFEQWIYLNSNKKENQYFKTKLILQGNLVDKWQKKVNDFNHPCKRMRFRLYEKGKFYQFEYSEFDRNVREMDRTGKLFRMFAALSSILKDARNGINHASSKLTESQIKDALETYIILGKELELTEKWKSRRQNERGIC